MTTEIAILNKSAVALAADSAVTISGDKNHKVFNSANKLFSLSKYAPVGIMIYGNASLSGVPWETIIKSYREFLGTKIFKYCKDYCDDFFKFLDKFDSDHVLSNNYFDSELKCVITHIRTELDIWAEKQFNDRGEILHSELVTQFKNIINNNYIKFQSIAKKSLFNRNEKNAIKAKYEIDIVKAYKIAFKKMTLSKNIVAKFLSIVINALSVGRIQQSGIVIAGFGAKELFPSCYSFDVAGIFENKTVRRQDNNQTICHENTAVIVPFAQSDDVTTFMEGIGPKLNLFLKDSFKQIFCSELPSHISDEISKIVSLPPKLSSKVSTAVEDICKGAYDKSFEKLDNIRYREYIYPILEATGFLNTSELAEMAETLVNLVSFRKKVSMETETVGGPIDVAVITKAEGLVWCKRKHYFPPELNHHFFGKYFERIANG